MVLDPFAFDMGDEFAVGIAGKYERRVLTETSVGFIGRIWDKRMDGDRMTGREYFEQELLEVACVNRGANQETTTALVKSMLQRDGMAQKVEGGGDNEVADLKDELLAVQDEVRLLANEIKRMGDALAAKAAVDEVKERREQLAGQLLKRLREEGLAR
jgi:hypothetical protein